MSADATPPEKVILFHRIAHLECASLRSTLVKNNLTDRIQFRNIDASEEAMKRLRAQTGGDQVPAAEWKGQWYQGSVAILQLLETLK